MKDNKKINVIFAVLLFCLLFLIEGTETKAKLYIDGGKYKGFSYSYINNGSEIALTGYSGNKENVTTPSKIKGKKVVEIGSRLFYSNYKIKKLTISEGIEEIGDWAFYNMQSLEWISLPQSLKKLQKETYLNYYSEASDFPKKTFVVVKGSNAFKTVTKNYSGSKIITKDAKKHIIWFDTKDYINKTDGESAKKIKSKYYKKGSKYKKLPKPTRRGYKFLGWYTKEKSGKKVTSNSYVKSDQILYAHWKFINYKSMLYEPYYDKNAKEYRCSKIGFGEYRDKYSSLSNNKMEWVVLELSGNKALVITDDLIDAQPYTNRKYDKDIKAYGLSPESSWATSDIRSWLNGYGEENNVSEKDYSLNADFHWGSFINAAFTDEEKSIIQDTVVVNSDSGGTDTIDKVFLLSLNEYQKYLKIMKHFEAYATEYASKYSGMDDSSNIYSFDFEGIWWLRTMTDSLHAYIVRDTTKVESIPTFGYMGTETEVENKDEYIPYVRPAMWIDLTNESLWEYKGSKIRTLDD